MLNKPSIAYDDFRPYVAELAGRHARLLILNAGRGWSAPWTIREYDSADATIADVNVPGATDAAIKLSAAEIVRPLGLRLWTSIRVGVHFSFDFVGGLSDPGLTLGLVNAEGGGYASADTGNFIGAATASPVDVGQMILDNQDVNNPFCTIRPFKRLTSGVAPAAVALAKVGTLTGSTSLGLVPCYSTRPSGSSTYRRSLFIIDIARGDPDYTVSTYVESPSLAKADATAEDFLTAMLLDKPRVQSENLIKEATDVLASEDPGAFNAVNVYWPSTVPLQVHAVSARVLS